MTKLCCLAVLASLIAVPAFSQIGDLRTDVLKHLKTSRDFTVKVAEAMPESDYDFKLTPPQMSFAQQMVHLASGLDYFLAAFSGEKPNPPKPASLHKADVVAFVKAQYDKALDTVSKLTPEQISKTYQSPQGEETGADLLIGVLDHSTHHRASAEMYLRAKGITPPEYEF
jgi:uncharacterized damage-inducible protein DinB